MLIAQISDTHIVPKHEHWLEEPLTRVDQRLAEVVEFLNQLDPSPDVVLLTGDVTEGEASAYRYFKELIQSLKSPLYVIPGNHDKREEMRSAFKDTPYMPKEGFIQYAIDDYPVRLIGLDTLVEGEVYGRLCEERVRWLENTLEQSPEKPTLIFMHHPPKKIGSKLFDEMICFCPPAFESLIEKDPVIGIIAGHYHHFCVNSFGKKPCFIAPSVAPVHYFAHPEDRDVTALELEDPAITLHLWEGDTGWVSHVRRIKENYKRLDWQSLKKKENVAPCLL